MRRLLVFLMLAVLLLSGCTVSTEPTQPTAPTSIEPTQTTSPTEQPGEIMFSPVYLPVYGLNPYTCTATLNRALFSLLYESLFAVSSSFRAEPVLCESFRIEMDGLQYTITLCADAQFSDGTPLTAADAAASLRAAKAGPVYSGRLAGVDSAEATGLRELTIRFNKVYENPAVLLDFPIVKEAEVSAPYPTGSGPYRYAYAALVRCDSWWQDAAAPLMQQTLPLRSAATAEEVRDAFELGGADMVYCDPNAPAAVSFRCDYEVWEVPTTVMHYLGFNMSGYFSDTSLRVALGRAVDRAALVNDCYGGFAQASVLPCSPNSSLYDRTLAARYGYAESALLSAVRNLPSFDPNQSAVFLVCVEDPARVTAAQRIVQVCTDAGLNVTLSALSAEEYHTALEKGEFDIYLGEVRLTSDFDLSAFFTSGGSLCVGGISDPTLSALCTAARANSGDYSTLYGRLLEQAPICPLVFKSYAVYATRGKLFALTPAVDRIFHNSTTARSLSDADKTVYAGE